MCAVNRNSTNIIKLLIGAGADIDAKDASGWTPRCMPASMGYTGAAQILIGAGAGVDAVNNDGWTALWIRRMEQAQGYR